MVQYNSVKVASRHQHLYLGVCRKCPHIAMTPLVSLDCTVGFPLQCILFTALSTLKVAPHTHVKTADMTDIRYMKTRVKFIFCQITEHRIQRVD